MVTKKLEYYQAAISAGEQVITNKAVRDNIEYLEERAYGCGSVLIANRNFIHNCTVAA